MAKTPERHYISKEPGKTLSLPEGLVYIDPFGRKRTTLLFPARGGKMLKTAQKEIQEFIEGVKSKDGEFEFQGNNYSVLPCRGFQRNIIERIPTPQEIKKREVERKQGEALVAIKALAAKPGVSIDVGVMKDPEIRDLAQDIGVETAKDGKKLSTEDIAKAVEQKIYG